MTSQQKLASNRANAQKSTGPRSKRGKARSACNALKHGLAAPVTLDTDTASQIASLARSLVGDQLRNPPVWIYAQQIAEAELDLVRIRQARAGGRHGTSRRRSGLTLQGGACPTREQSKYAKRSAACLPKSIATSAERCPAAARRSAPSMRCGLSWMGKKGAITQG